MAAIEMKSHSPSLDALQSLLEQLDCVSRFRLSTTAFDQLLDFTHTLSHRLSEVLHHLVEMLAEDESEAMNRLPRSIDAASDAITTCQQLMLSLHYFRRLQSSAK